MTDVFESIYLDHKQGLFTLALSITGNPDRAEDAVQEGFARLFRLKANPSGDPVAYAFAAVRNAAVDQKRRGRGKAPVLAGDAIFDGQKAADDGPDAASLNSEQEDRVRQAINELPEEQQETIIMKVYGGLTFEQISETLNLPLGTVASRYRRGLERMKRLLEPYLAGED